MGKFKFSPLVEKAIDFAEEAHLHQRRKDDVPYVVHPVEVAKILKKSPREFEDEALAASVLHDIIEDTLKSFDDIDKAFGMRVAGLVWLLSKPKGVDMSSIIYFAAIAECSPTVIAIKLADMLHNLRSLDDDFVNEEWAEGFRSKIKKYGLPLVGVLRCHGDCWIPFADWIEPQMKKEIGI